MDLKDLRSEIDKLDDEILDLFIKRMNVVENVIEVKKKEKKSVFNSEREREILNRIADNTPSKYEVYSRVLFSNLFELSRTYQSGAISGNELETKIESSIDKNSTFPSRAMVACQGVEGAYSQLATDKLFSLANILYFRHFEGVFSAVEKGLCRYGILPIENSSYGSVNEVYDLMKNHNFHIVRTIKLHINHVLLSKNKIDLNKITEIFSHEQAIGQCSEFLRNNPNIKITVCENTAIAAKMVAESEREDVCAISSPNCAELYGLKVIKTDIQNSDNNYTRFICISKELEIFSGADKISIMLNLPHRPGALYSVMSKFNSLGINLSKLESRPILGSDFEFMFYFDIDALITDKKVVKLLCEFSSSPEQFVFLGAYTEV